MNILNVLKKLRDDIKTWATNNFNALNAKIDQKTIPIDNELDITSTNPVQNKAIATEVADINRRVGDTTVAKQITDAINKQPHFSGDYNDLTNAPNISEDESGDMIVTDESGNIIFKVDEEGIHTTDVSINGEVAATKAYVDNSIATKVDFTGYATESYVNQKIADLVDSAPEALDTLGELAEALNNHEDAYDALLETIGNKATYADLDNLKEELSESIVAESSEWKIVDLEGNIVFNVDSTGAHTTSMTLGGKNAATEEYVDNAISNIPSTDLTNYATISYVDDAISSISIPEVDFTGYATETFVKQEISNTTSNYYNKEEVNAAIKTAKEELSESIVAESDEWKVVDEAGNVIFSVDDEGAHTTNLSLNGEVVATEKYVNDIIAENKSYNVGPIEDKALWLRVAKLDLTSMGSASGTFVINYKTIVTDLETEETKTYFLGSAKFDLGASTTVLGGKQRYSLEVTPIFSSLIPVKWASNGTNTPDELEDEFDYEMLLTSVGSGSGLTIYGISHVRLIADPDDVDEVYLEIFFNNPTLRDEKIFEIELSNNKNIVLLDEITQGSIFTDVFEHRIALNDGDTFYKNSATLTHSRIDGLVVDTNTMILFKDSTNNYYRFGWVDNSFVKESMYPASGGGMASGEILEIYHHDLLEDGKYIIWSWVPCDITEVLSLEGDTNGFAIVLKDYYIETKTLEDTPVGQITLEQIFGELYNDLINLEMGVTAYDAEESNT